MDDNTEKKRAMRVHYHETRDYELAESLLKLPDFGLLSCQEIGALTGLAPTSFARPTQRKLLGMPEPLRLGRLLKWRLCDIRVWLGPVRSNDDQPKAKRGRPTKGESMRKAQFV